MNLTHQIWDVVHESAFFTNKSINIKDVYTTFYREKILHFYTQTPREV